MIALLAWLAIERRPVMPTLLSLARMTIQLLAVGFFLVFLFRESKPWLTLLALVVMGIAATAIAVRTSQAFDWHRLAMVGLSMLIASVFTLGIVLVFVLEIWPWQEPTTVIPLAGMTLSSAMNALSLAIERFDTHLAIDHDRPAAAKQALDTALIPITNNLMAVGVVSIPGMMTGQVLAGVSPYIAARYQIVIMCCLFASAGLSTKIYLALEQKRQRST
jgi:putative ABC transport system permease protein